jgi:hypothetical protein
MNGINAGIKFCAFVAIILVGGYLVCEGHQELDSLGLLQHQEETTITIQGNWMEGESKLCWSPALNSAEATLRNKETGYALSSLDCGDSNGEMHSMRVKFYGREVQPEYDGIIWRCVREQPSTFDSYTFTCYETGGLTLERRTSND